MDLFERDLFTDPELIQDPAPYPAELRRRGPVVREPHLGVFLVSGLEEILGIHADLDSFSAVVAPLGPFVTGGGRRRAPRRDCFDAKRRAS